MPTTTSDFFPDSRKCDSYHEAGHAVIGVLLEHVLTEASSITGADTSPHCSWNDDKFAPLMQAADPVLATTPFVNSHALMCLAAQFFQNRLNAN